MKTNNNRYFNGILLPVISTSFHTLQCYCTGLRCFCSDGNSLSPRCEDVLITTTDEKPLSGVLAVHKKKDQTGE